jgi:hypothetical protein
MPKTKTIVSVVEEMQPLESWKKRLKKLEPLMREWAKNNNMTWGQVAFQQITGAARNRYYQVMKSSGQLTMEEAGHACRTLGINPHWLLGTSDVVFDTNVSAAEAGDAVIKVAEMLKSPNPYASALVFDINRYYQKYLSARVESDAAGVTVEPEPDE